MKNKLEEILNDFGGEFKNNEVAGVNAVAEYITSYAVQDFNEIENPENIANIVNKNLGTDFEKKDIEKIGKIVEAEMNNEIEPVGWDEEVDMDKINEIYEENKEVLDKTKNPFVENVENENKEKTENTETEEDKQSLIESIAEDAFLEMTDNLQNSENILDSAVGEMYKNWREEYLEEKEKQKQQEIEEAFKDEQNNEQEDNKNIENEVQEAGQEKQQNEAEFAENQAKEAAAAEEMIEAGAEMSM